MIKPEIYPIQCSTSLHLFPCDSPKGALFVEEHCGCFVKILNDSMGLFQFETPTHLVFGVGNPMNSIEYMHILLRLLGFLDEQEDKLSVMRWLEEVFTRYKFSQPPLLVEIHGVTRLCRKQNGFWVLTFPNSAYEKGFGNPYQFIKKHKSMLKEYYGSKFNDFVENKFDVLYGEDQKSPNQ